MADRGSSAVRLIFLTCLLVLVGCDRAETEVQPTIPVGPQEGLRAPPIEGTAATGEALAPLQARTSPTVLVFYRSAGCGLCRVHLREIQSNIAGYMEQGASLVGVTLDPPPRSEELVAELGLSFPILSVDSATFSDWEVLNSEQGVTLPATYIVDRNGVIRFRHVGRNAADRASAAGVMTVLQSISQAE